MTDWKIIQGDALATLKTIQAESVHCVVTSPPYFGLRDYGTASWDGGDPDCDHQKSELRRGVNLAQSVHSTRGGAIKAAEVGGIPYRDVCGKCQAIRVDGQLGLEATPQQFIANMVAVFAEVRRVLRRDGTLWLNLGDSYWTDSPVRTKAKEAFSDTWDPTQTASRGGLRKTSAAFGPWKNKDLLGMPWRVAFALQEAGWWLRQDIIWHKPNPMPESVDSRCTKAHEYLFLLARSRKYYYDNETIKEQSAEPDRVRNDRIGGANGHTVRHSPGGMMQGVEYRNKRSVWTVATQPYSEAHFATFPPKLIEPCILAGTSEKGACGDCLAPWERIVERVPYTADKMPDGWDTGPGHHESFHRQGREKGKQRDRSFEWSRNGLDGSNSTLDTEIPQTKTIGWQKTCNCETDEIVPCTVLDPFAGSGTTMMVATRHRRRSIGIELNPAYIEIAHKRLTAVQVELF